MNGSVRGAWKGRDLEGRRPVGGGCWKRGELEGRVGKGSWKGGDLDERINVR